MKTKDLIGKEIVEIRFKISKVDYEGSIPLEEIDVELKLTTGEIISFPHHPDGIIGVKQNFNLNLKRIFPDKRIFKLLWKPNIFENLKNQKIIGIWSAIDFGEKICFLEFQNGYFLAKGSISPIGIGNADLFLLGSKEELKKKYEGEIQKVF